MTWRGAIVAASLLLVAGSAYALSYIGYFGGPLFLAVPATAAPGHGRDGLAAVVFSGDMGFHVGMGPRVARRLAADGIPVLSVNSLVYFRHARTPDEAEKLIEETSRRAMAFGHARQLVLIGQSFGADILHVGLAGLPEALRAHIRLIGLVVPTNSVSLLASPADLLSWAAPTAPALPTAGSLTWAPVICIRGVLESDSLCPMLSQPNLREIVLPGGHYLDRDDAAVHRALLAAIDQSRRPG
jgi:type IV secretory pathway VirJ component